ncbi:probable trehalose-phosphate phosphatase F, partial [Tanacetum coccineum]
QGKPARDFIPMIDEVYKTLVEGTTDIPGAFIENHKFCTSVHYRNVDDKSWPMIAQCVHEVLKDYPRLIITHGLKVLDVRPVIDSDKGKAVEFLLESLGDDRTDKDAFKVLREGNRGYGILLLELSFAESLFVVLGSMGAAIFGSFNPLLAYVIALILTEYYRNETMLRNEVGWFDEEENNVDTLFMRLANDATFVRADFSNRLSIFIQDFTAIILIGMILQWWLALMALTTLLILTLSAIAQATLLCLMMMSRLSLKNDMPFRDK